MKTVASKVVIRNDDVGNGVHLLHILYHEGKYAVVVDWFSFFTLKISKDREVLYKGDRKGALKVWRRYE
jgi:hypothetical protein